MNRHLILTNYGVRFVKHQQEALPQDDFNNDPVLKSMRLLLSSVESSVPANSITQELTERGLAQWIGLEVPREEIELRYRRNPLENIKRVVFEYTTECQLSCLHCRNGHAPRITERRGDALKEVVDLMIPLGVSRFAFVGGEVTLFGNGWLDVVEHSKHYKGTSVGIVTSGWFLEQTRFTAAGVQYADDLHYLVALRERGVTHVIFSIDGPEDVHDSIRKCPGLYVRIQRGLKKTRDTGLVPRLSLVITDATPKAWLLDLLDRVYSFSGSMTEQEKLEYLNHDLHSYVNSFVDIGNGVALSNSRRHIDDIDNPALRCKNFFRPWPSLRIQANGQVSLCPLIDAGEGYGSLHERGLLDILNDMQSAFVYRLHADGTIADYRPFMDTSIFGARFDHVCTLRAILTMIASEMHNCGIDARNPATYDAKTIRSINVEVARKAGFLPPRREASNVSTSRKK